MSVTIPTAHVPTSSRMVFAHRGLNHQAPENTMPAFDAAAGAGVQWIETDVDIIADGTPADIRERTGATDIEAAFLALVDHRPAGDGPTGEADA